MNTARLQPLAITASAPHAPPAGELRAELPPRSIVGRVLGNRYLPELLLEEGTFSVRYRADDMSRNEPVCIELLPRRMLSSFGALRQAAARLAALGDPNIVEVRGHGVAGGVWPFLVSDHVEGNLRDSLCREGAFELRRVVRIGAQCASALAAAHRVGVIHGALTPERISLGEPAPLELARISGFGLAPVVQAARAELLGCPPEVYRYCAPELAQGEPASARSDVYSLGAVLYELAVGQPAFEGSAAGVLLQPRGAEPQAPSRRRGSKDLAFRAFDKIVTRCLAASPDQRYASAAELAADLARLDAALARVHANAPAAGPARPQNDTEPASGPRASSTPPRRSAAEASPPRLPPKPRERARVLPKVIVQAS